MDPTTNNQRRAIQPRLIPGDVESLVVTQANALATSIQDMSLLERRVLILALAVLSRSDSELPFVRIYNSDIRRAFNIHYGTLGGALDEVTNKIMTRYAVFMRGRHGSNSKISWVNEVHYTSGNDSEDGMSYIDIQLHPKMSSYVLQLTGKFFSVPLTVLAKFRSVYSMRLCEILTAESQAGKIPSIYFDLPELKTILSCDTKSYQNFSNFRQRILEPALTENKDVGFLSFDYELVRRGRKVIGIKFRVAVNTGSTSDALDHFELGEQHVRRLALENSMREAGFKESPRAFIERLGVDTVEQIYRECRAIQGKNRGTKQEIRNFGGFLHKRLKDELDNPIVQRQVAPTLDEGDTQLSSDEIHKIADTFLQELTRERTEYAMQTFELFDPDAQALIRQRMPQELDPWTLENLKRSNWEGSLYRSAVRRVLENSELQYPEHLRSAEAYVTEEKLHRYPEGAHQKIIERIKAYE